MGHNLYYLFISGIILGYGPCLLTCAPPLLSYTVSQKAGLRRSLSSYAIFSAGRLLSYAVLGVICGLFAEALHFITDKSYMIVVSAALGGFIIILGIATISMVSDPAKRVCGRLHKGDIRNVGLLGILMGLIPCLPLIGIMDYTILISNSWLDGLIYILVFGIGTAISPLIILAALTGAVPERFVKSDKVTRVVRVVSGLILIVVGTYRIIVLF